MPVHYSQAKKLVDKLTEKKTLAKLKDHLSQKLEKPQVRVPTGNDQAAFLGRLNMLPISAEKKAFLSNGDSAEIEIYQKNIENFLGTVKVPIGLAGPLRVNGLYASGDYLIPLATTEAALVASYNRGTKIISESGGCTSVLLNTYVSRCPSFAFHNLAEVGEFLIWINQNAEVIRQKAESTTHHGKLIDLRFSVVGNLVFISFDYNTEDASGQNMVTIATQAAFEFIKANAPVKPKYAYIESNMSGDKKASVLAFQNTRGRKVVAEAHIPKALVEKKLYVSVDTLVEFFRSSEIGGLLAGIIGAEGHYANALAAMYIALGQDAACVSESSLGITRLEKTESGDLYAAVTLPNVMVGTVGGGTHLPSQRACLELMGLYGPGHANALAEVVAGVCLAGEISICAAMASNTFTKAHQDFARGKSTLTGEAT